jgi:WD40 repeat protein
LNNKEKKITVLHTFKINPVRKINNVLVINSETETENSEAFQALSEADQRTRQTDRFLVIYGDNPNEEVNSRASDEKEQAGTTDAFEFRGFDDQLYMINVQSPKEHDLPLTGFDWLKSLKLIVTSDRSGSIRIWSDKKKFIREIKFPASDPIDSVCFINPQGDLIVSHS